MSFVTPMVAIGDMGVAQDRHLLRLHGIGAILSLAPVPLGGPIAHHLVLEVADRVPLPSPAISAAVAFIDKHVREERRVLLHCHMGISRSPALAVCYLHETQGMTIEEALQHVKYVRPIADPHPELLRSIREHYANAPRRRPGGEAESGPVPPPPTHEVG